MPSTVFLSYARANLALAEQLERELATLGLTVWRDQEQLHTGVRWPKALGEAIAASDAFLLLWSADSAQSDFVELEWTTALALKKPILPCLIDQTPLPPSLTAYNATSIAGAANQIRAALTAQSASATTSPENTKRVIAQLANIPATTPAAVLNQFRTNPQSKTIWDKLQSPFAILASIVTIFVGVVALWPNHAPKFSTPQEQSVAQQQQQPFAGSIWDNSNEPLSNVKVSLLLNEKLLASSLTDNLGRYTFRVTAAPDADITLLAQKEGFHTEKRYTQLGNTNFNFTMNRGPR